MCSVTVFFGILIALGEKQMMEPINLAVTSPKRDVEKPLPEAGSADKGFEALLMKQKPRIEEKDTEPNKNRVKALDCSAAMGVPAAFPDQNNIAPSNSSAPKDPKDSLQPSNLSDDQAPSQLNNNLNGSPGGLSSPSFKLDAKAIRGQGTGSPVISSASSQNPFTSDSPNGMLASLIPSMMEVLKAFLEQNSISLSNPLDSNLDSKTVPGQGAGSSLIPSSSSQVPLTPDSPDGTLASLISSMMKVLRASLDQNNMAPSNPSDPQDLKDLLRSTNLPDDQVPSQLNNNLNRSPETELLLASSNSDAKTIPGQGAGSPLITSSSSQIPFSPDSSNGTLSPFSPNQTDHSIQNISPYLNLKVETAIPTVPLQENQGDGNPSFNPAGLERESFHSSSGVESKETGTILFDENGSVLRSIKGDHQNSELFTLFNDQKGSPESNPVMPEEVQKGHETILPKTVPVQIYQQIGKNVIWSIQNNQEKIKLTLDPPELGNIYMEINREKGNVRAILWTDNPVTKEILEAHHGQLYTILKEDGFKLEKFDVFMQQDMGSFQDRGERVLHDGPWARDEFKEDTISTALEASEISSTILSRSDRGSNHVDLFV